jgi:hypothetical protein
VEEQHRCELFGICFAMVLFFLCVDIVGAKGWNKPMEVKDKRKEDSLQNLNTFLHIVCFTCLVPWS